MQDCKADARGIIPRHKGFLDMSTDRRNRERNGQRYDHYRRSSAI